MPPRRKKITARSERPRKPLATMRARREAPTSWKPPVESDSEEEYEAEETQWIFREPDMDPEYPRDRDPVKLKAYYQKLEKKYEAYEKWKEEDNKKKQEAERISFQNAMAAMKRRHRYVTDTTEGEANKKMKGM